MLIETRTVIDDPVTIDPAYIKSITKLRTLEEVVTYDPEYVTVDPSADRVQYEAI